MNEITSEVRVSRVANNITRDRLKELLHYNPDNGVFTRRINKSNMKAGCVAGCVDNKGYMVIKADGKKYFAHRLAHLYMNGKFPEGQVDHEDHDRANNEWSNINRDVSNQENGKNQTIYSTNTSGFTGVYWDKVNKKWFANIRLEGKLMHLGYFSDIESTISARKAANIKYGFHVNHGKGKAQPRRES